LVFVLGIVFGLIYSNAKRAEVRKGTAILSGLAAYAYYQESDFYNAVNYSIIAKQFRPEDFRNRKSLGLLYGEMGLYEFAIIEYDQILHEKPTIDNPDFNYAQVHCEKAIVFSKLGKDKEAYASFAAAIKLYPDMPEELYKVYLKYKDPEKSNALSERYIEMLMGMKKAGVLSSDISERIDKTL